MGLKNGRDGGNRVVFVSLMSIAIFCLSSIAMADTVSVNFNSKVIDGIEFYVQTDKAIYNLGENVEMLYKVTNFNDYSVNFGFGHMPEWNFWVEQNGINIWTKVQFPLAVAISYTIDPGESRVYPYIPPVIWNMKDNDGSLISSGIYEVIGGYDWNWINGSYDYSKISVPITIIPEPSSVMILSLGVLGLFFRRNKKQ